LIIDMVVTNSGKPLSPIEMAEAVRRLINFGYTTKDVATKFGKTTHFIRNLELLASAPKRIRDLVAENKISYSWVLLMLKECTDFNEATNKIEEALNFSIKESRISKRHLNEVRNVVDSFKELRSVFKKQIDKPSEVLNPELVSFAKRLLNNELTANQIEKLLYL
jgi:hypothetical protein